MANSDMKKALELERKIYKEMKAREDASRQKEADETADMFNERELARLQDENRRLRAFVEKVAHINRAVPLHTGGIMLTVDMLEKQAAALLASMKPARDSEQ